MNYSTTPEIAVTMNRNEYRAQLAQAVRELASVVSSKESEVEYDPKEELAHWVTEYVLEEGGVWLTHPVSVIEHSESTMSHRGASRLGDVTTTEDFAQEHARDLFEQDIVSHLEAVLEGEPVEDVVFDDPGDRNSGGVPVSGQEEETPDDYVMITPETASCAVDELDLHLGSADDEMDTSRAEAALDELQRAIAVDTPRTRVCRASNMEEVVIPGVPRGTLKIDYLPETPMIALHTPDNSVIEPVIHLPRNEEDGATESGEKTPSADGGDA